jgi:ABC-2 type transport system ATP-binding protein
MSFLRAENVVKRYANHLALDNVSIEVPEGCVFGLLGPNGAGKTTLIRIINQITAPDTGAVYINGERLKPDHVHNIGYLPEERGLYKKMKVGEQAMYLAQLKGLSSRDAKKKLKFWFEKFEIIGWWDKKIEELSKGMAQKIQFIVTILHEPKLLIFDEPFSGFDPINTNLLKDEIMNLKNNGATVIFSTHNMASVEEVCDSIALINRSKKILDGNVDQIKQDFKSNVFEIDYKAKNGSSADQWLDQSFKLIGKEKNKDLERVRIQILNGETPNQLLNTLIPHAEIYNFNEILPSMNDIFIQKVREYDPNYNPEQESI